VHDEEEKQANKEDRKMKNDNPNLTWREVNE